MPRSDANPRPGAPDEPGDLDEVVDLYDAAGRPCGTKRRAALVDGVDRWAIAVVLLIHPDGRLALGRRAATKRHDPGRWQPAVAETVQAGEPTRTAALRGTAEELGVILAPGELVPLAHHVLDTPGQRRFVAAYRWTAPADLGALGWDAAERDVLAWWDPGVLAATLVAEPDRFVPTLAPLVARI